MFRKIKSLQGQNQYNLPRKFQSAKTAPPSTSPYLARSSRYLVNLTTPVPLQSSHICPLPNLPEKALVPEENKHIGQLTNRFSILRTRSCPVMPLRSSRRTFSQSANTCSFDVSSRYFLRASNIGVFMCADVFKNKSEHYKSQKSKNKSEAL